jgi:hypothetical protein
MRRKFSLLEANRAGKKQTSSFLFARAFISMNSARKQYDERL